MQTIQAATGWEFNNEDITEPRTSKNITLESWIAALHMSDYFQRSYDDD